MANFVGIDISKDKFDVARARPNNKKGYLSTTYTNNKTGITKFMKTLKPGDHIIMEATGVYYLRLAHALDDATILFSVINPAQSKYFAKVYNNALKNDKMDAIMLYNYGKAMNPKTTRLLTKEQYELKHKRLLINTLKKTKVRLKNILHSLEIHPYPTKEVVKVIKKQIASLETELKTLMDDLIQLSKEKNGQQYKLLTSIKGIGPKTAIALIYATNGFTFFEHSKQFSRFIGISPTTFESGSSVRRRSRMNRSGDPELRSLLYVCTWSAIRYNKACKKKYEDMLSRGKPSMVALVAIMNKLVKQAFGVIKNQQKFDNNYETKQQNLVGV